MEQSSRARMRRPVLHQCKGVSYSRSQPNARRPTRAPPCPRFAFAGRPGSGSLRQISCTRSATMIGIPQFRKKKNATLSNAALGMAAGAAAGLFGAWVMNRFQAASKRLLGREELSERAHSPKQNGRPAILTEGSDRPDKPANVLVAEKIGKRLLDRDLEPSEKDLGAQLVHYGFGLSAGAAYGILREFVPTVAAGSGSAFGAAVWLLADITTLPAVGLSDGFDGYRLSKHAYSLGAHVVYGLATEAARGAIHDALKLSRS